MNPRKYAAGLLSGAIRYGAKVYGNAAVAKVSKSNNGFNLRTQDAEIAADRIILATNDYSSEDIPSWMRARFMPVQSSIIVTRALSNQELKNQGWTSDQMAFDTRGLLHYFRLLPDRRFLFGMRGGLFSTHKVDRYIARLIRRNFTEIFEAWKDVEIDYEWSGLACLNRSRLPFVGPIPDMDGAFAGFAYHGNGIAMGIFSGAFLSDLAMGHRPSGPYSSAMQQVPQRFPFGRYRRQILRPIYQWKAWQDR